MTHRGRFIGGLATTAAIAAAIAAAPRAKACDDSAQARVELGRRLFFDPAIGRRGQVACAACHDPEHGFADARPFSQDETRVLSRHSQPLVDLAGAGFHWNGEFDTVRDVIDARVLPGALAAKAAAERALRRLEAVVAAGAVPDSAAVTAMAAQLDAGGPYDDGGSAESVAAGFDLDLAEPEFARGAPVPIRRRPAGDSIAGRIARGGRYDVGFVAAFGDGAVTSRRIGDALEAYLGSLKSTTSRLDRHLAGDAEAIGESARRGLELFRGKANCSQCHVVEGAQPQLSDGQFHNTGIAARSVGDSREAHDRGRRDATFAAADHGAFKTPSLRDVARRAPYFHDASAKSLDEVVRYYVQGGTANAHLDPKIRPLSLTDQDVADIVALLESMTGDVRPGLAPAHASRAPRITVRVENLDGTPVADCVAVVRPFGDRLAGTSAMPAPVTAKTGARGVAVIDMPASTHVVVEAAGAGASAPLPDWTSTTTFVVTPKDRVALRIRFADGNPERPACFVAYAGGLQNPGAPAKFEKVRDLGPSETLYAGTPPARLKGVLLCSVCPQEAKAVRGGEFALDFAGGATNAVDLRPSQDETDGLVRAALAKDVARIRGFAPPRTK